MTQRLRRYAKSQRQVRCLPATRLPKDEMNSARPSCESAARTVHEILGTNSRRSGGDRMAPALLFGDEQLPLGDSDRPNAAPHR